MRSDDDFADEDHMLRVAQAPPEFPGRFRLRTLGATAITRDGEDIGGPWLEQRCGELLKLLLARRPRVVLADEIIDELWPMAGGAALNNLRFTVHKLRDHLDGKQRARGGADSLVISHRNGYRLDLTRMTIDADRFVAGVERGLQAARGGRGHVAEVLLAGALELYEGEFLADLPYADWVAPERERICEVAAQALGELARAAEKRGDLQSASRALRRLADLEPYDESVQRDLVRLCLVRGRRGEAMRRYATVRERLRRDLDHEPDFSVASLMAELRSA